MKRERKKTLKRVILVILLLGVLCAAVLVGINIYMVQSAKPYILTPEEAAKKQTDCVMVLGARVWDDGTPSAMLADRLDYGVDLYQNEVAPKLLVTGDHGRRGYDEVNAMKTYAMENNVPAEDVFMDHAGFSTYESMYRARDVFSVESLTVVTQEYHLYRAIYIARRLGLDAWGVASDPRTYSTKRYDDTREFLARCKAFAMCIYQPEPTFLGDVIPINGSGTATDDRNYQLAT